MADEPTPGVRLPHVSDEPTPGVQLPPTDSVAAPSLHLSAQQQELSDHTGNAARLDEPQQDFVDFLRTSSGFVGAIIAASPILMDFLGFLKAPQQAGNPDSAKTISVIMAVVSASIFLSLFWTRSLVGSKVNLVLGLVLLIIGGFLLMFFTMLQREVAWAITQTILYMIGFMAAVTGISLVFISGFVLTKQRQLTLLGASIILNRQQWKFLENCSRSLVNAENYFSMKRIPGLSKFALRRSLTVVMQECESLIASIHQGKVMVSGPMMDTIFEVFLSAVRKEFKAISDNDLHHWLSNEVNEYLNCNKTVIANGKRIERIFLIEKTNLESKDLRLVVEKQIAIGVEVRVCLSEMLHRDLRYHGLDFGIFDKDAVSYWQISNRRTFSISTEIVEVESRCQIYGRVKSACLQTREIDLHTAEQGDASLITKMEQFDLMISHFKTVSI